MDDEPGQAVATGPRGLRDRALAVWRRTPVDLIGLVVIAAAIVVTHKRFILHGMCFNDPSWYFHFGHRVAAEKAVPYRDFVFQVGPLPIYVDATFQAIFGSKYAASLYAALFIKVLRVWVVWAIVRRLASLRAAGLIAVYCALDPLFMFAHHWSTAYVHLFITLAGLFLLLASRATRERAALTHLALAGLSAALIMSARQSAAIMVGLVLAASAAALVLRRELTPRRLLALGAGYAAGVVLLFGALAALGALGPAIQQMFLDAPQKKGIEGLPAALDAISGGAFTMPEHHWAIGFLLYLALPAVVVGAVLYLASHEREIALQTIGLVLIPIAFFIGLLVRYAELNYFSDLPRTFFTATTALAVLAPQRVRAWFGVPPLLAIAFGGLPLACDWALEMSFPGRGWGDAPSLILGVFLFALASSRLGGRAKTLLCGALAAASLINFAIAYRLDLNPFAKDTAGDGTRSETTESSANPRLRGLKVTQSRKLALDWLQQTVPPHSTCFVYGNLPVLYTLLGCQNPTRIDSTAADFITADDAEAAIEALRKHPPDYIIAHEKSWMNPPLTLDLEGKVERYEGLNPRASMVIHTGLRALLRQYTSVGTVGKDAMPDYLAAQAAKQWDIIDQTRVYRKKSLSDVLPGIF
jgi:hypothetical protein